MSSRSSRQTGVAFFGQVVCEWTLYLAIALSPWAFGSTSNTFEFFLACAIALVVCVSGIVAVVDGPIRWSGGRPAFFFVAGLLGLAAVPLLHLMELPSSWLNAIAPGVGRWSTWDLSSGNTPDSIAGWASGQRLGLNAGGSYQFLIRILMLVGLFSAIQIFRSPTVCLRRLSLVAAVTGTALAIFGLAQHFGSHDGLVYWTFNIQGGLGFGPFINRNHYPFFLNLCLGMTIGLLMDRLASMGTYWYRMLLSDAAVAWLMAAISFMVASLIACGSRGGVISGFLAISIVCLLRLRASNAARGMLISGSLAVPIVLVLIWVGFSLQDSRLTMLAEADRYTSDGRWSLWQAAIQSVPEFLWFGSGGETYQHWETIYQNGDPEWSNWKAVSLRADNEFLDILNEYGLFGLLSLLTFVIAILFQSLVRCRHDALSAGATIGLQAVFFHSFVDFGLRVPATAVLATCVAALLMAQSRRSSTRTQTRHQKSSPTAWQRSLASICLGAVLITIGLYAFRVKHRYFRADRLRVAALKDMEINRDERAIEQMTLAVATTPEDIPIRIQLGRMIQFVLKEQSLPSIQQQLAQQMVINSKACQQLCPLAWRPYAWLAQYDLGLRAITVERKAPDMGAEPRAVVLPGQVAALLKARELHPSEPDLAYLMGDMLAERNGIPAAIPHWRDSLTYSSHHLPEILDRVGDRLSPNELATRLLPNDPVRTLEAATSLAEQRGVERLILLERTIELLDDPEQVARRLSFGQAEDLRSRALEKLGKPNDAIVALDRAIQEDLEDISRRVRLAKLLIATEQWKRATSEIRILLSLAPDNGQAKALQQELSKLKAKAIVR